MNVPSLFLGNRRLAAAWMLLLSVLMRAQGYCYTNYTSPYFYVPEVTNAVLTADFRQLPRAVSNSNYWTRTSPGDWTNFDQIKALKTLWGPYFILFPAPAGVIQNGSNWCQLRLMAAADQIRGAVPYAHHHTHVWNVPNTALWTNAGYTPGVGIDCSDFTHWIFSYGLGLELPTGVGMQSQSSGASIFGPGTNIIQVVPQRLFNVHRGFKPVYTNLVESLLPGDLLYIRSNPALTNPISHVIMWLGNYAYDTNHQDNYLITDSHGDIVTDSNNAPIPSGPQIRPFRPQSYYFNSFDHVLRFVPLNSASGPF